MYATRYIKAGNIDEAVTALNSAEDGKILAGGMTLIPTLKQRLAAPDCLIDLSASGLSSITDEGEEIAIGAMTTHAEVEHSAIIQEFLPVLAQLAGGIGDRQVRNRGTIGGSIANNDPAACYPAAILGLDASIQTNKRLIAAEDYFTGMFETALAEDEIITEIRFAKTRHASYIKFSNPASRYAMVGVCVARSDTGEVRVAITGAGQDGVFRHAGLEAALTADFNSDSIDKVQIEDSALMSDIHASADYRAHLIKEMTRRAVRAL
ncbi:MAG: FAD binding domain-containing protein [Candidatus Puniceispirillaceae bacterium]